MSIISHVLSFCTANGDEPRTPVTIIYLRITVLIVPFNFGLQNAPTIVWVSRSWGLPRSTLLVSKQTSSLWHFQRVYPVSLNDLGKPLAVSYDNCPSLFIG